ncbi:MAG: extracellular solute-binding protein [Sphaerochaetaceae bacterium]|jgi:iron(III) transport system substrate-binding protein
MKKVFVTLLIGLVILGTIAGGGAKEKAAVSGPSGRLVLYTPDFDEELNMVVDPFQAKYPNIKVELVQAGAGELKTRIRAEAANPQADILAGGVFYNDYVNMPDLWEPYIASNDSDYPESMRNSTGGAITFKTVQLVNLLVNKPLAKELGVEIKSYADLLNPKLKGKIITADPNGSSSAWNQLSTILGVMGGYESAAAWGYVESLIQNLDGVMSGSSSTVYKGVLEGEYVVGLTYEAPCVTYIREGKGDIVEIVYPSEGINAIAGAHGIVKNAKNLENAKLFIEFVASDEMQAAFAASTVRQANLNLPTTNEYLTPIDQIRIEPRDEAYLAKNQKNILERWNFLWAKYN